MFPFPKSIYAVMDALAAVVRTRPHALIVDFFAGSGTTLHSTCMLNSVYGGQRQCILVTNNEVNAKLSVRLKKNEIEPGSSEYEKHGICSAVTWPRIQAVLTGRRRDKSKLPGKYLDGRAMSQGFEENVKYLKLDFLDPADIGRGEKYEAILPILWLMAGACGDLKLLDGSVNITFRWAVRSVCSSRRTTLTSSWLKWLNDLTSLMFFLSRIPSKRSTRWRAK